MCSAINATGDRWKKEQGSHKRRRVTAPSCTDLDVEDVPLALLFCLLALSKALHTQTKLYRCRLARLQPHRCWNHCPSIGTARLDASLNCASLCVGELDCERVYLHIIGCVGRQTCVDWLVIR